MTRSVFSFCSAACHLVGEWNEWKSQLHWQFFFFSVKCGWFLPAAPLGPAFCLTLLLCDVGCVPHLPTIPLDWKQRSPPPTPLPKVCVCPGEVGKVTQFFTCLPFPGDNLCLFPVSLSLFLTWNTSLTVILQFSEPKSKLIGWRNGIYLVIIIIIISFISETHFLNNCNRPVGTAVNKHDNSPKTLLVLRGWRVWHQEPWTLVCDRSDQESWLHCMNSSFPLPLSLAPSLAVRP